MNNFINPHSDFFLSLFIPMISPCKCVLLRAKKSKHCIHDIQIIVYCLVLMMVCCNLLPASFPPSFSLSPYIFSFSISSVPSFLLPRLTSFHVFTTPALFHSLSLSYPKFAHSAAIREREREREKWSRHLKATFSCHLTPSSPPPSL